MSLKKIQILILKLPENLDKAIENSKKNNPELIIAKLDYEQSEKDVVISRSDLSPSATLSLSSTKTEDLQAQLLMKEIKNS